jgi:transcriptional regulator with XRE-family HTH domain
MQISVYFHIYVKIMQDFDEKAIIERVKSLRQQYAGSRGKSKFARALGISPSTYSYYEENRVPPTDILLKMCEVTGSDLEWLLKGRCAEETLISGANRKFLQKLDGLLTKNPELTEPVLAFVELLRDKKGLEEKHDRRILSTEAARPGWIPVLGRTAAGIVHFWDQSLLPEPKQAITQLEDLVEKYIGRKIIKSVDAAVSIDLQTKVLANGLKIQQANLIQVTGRSENQLVEFVQCDEIHKLFPDSFALQIDGDSMSPKINDGDIVIISPSVAATQGQIAIARLANQIGVTCKLIRTTEKGVHLIPINERYETKVVGKKDLLWALAVLCHITI